MWNGFNVTTFKTKRALKYSLMRVRSERFATDCKLHVKTVTLKLQADICTVSASFPTRHTGRRTFIYLAKTYYWFAPTWEDFRSWREQRKTAKFKIKENARCFNLFAVRIQLHTGNVRWQYCVNYCSPYRLLSRLTESTGGIVVGREEHMAELRNLMQHLCCSCAEIWASKNNNFQVIHCLPCAMDSKDMGCRNVDCIRLVWNRV